MDVQGDRVVLRPLAEDDVPRIVELGSDPEVARWWPGLTSAHVLDRTMERHLIEDRGHLLAKELT